MFPTIFGRIIQVTWAHDLLYFLPYLAELSRLHGHDILCFLPYLAELSRLHGHMTIFVSKIIAQ